MAGHQNPVLYASLLGIFLVVIILSCWRAAVYDKRRRSNNREAALDHLPRFNGVVVSMT